WDRVFSRFRPESELCRVNRDPAKVVVLSRLFAHAARVALGAAAATEGLVDPTLGLAIEAAGYDRDSAELRDDRPLAGGSAGRAAALAAVGRRARPERRGQVARRRRGPGRDLRPGFRVGG